MNGARTADTQEGIIDGHANIPGKSVVEHPWDRYTQGCEDAQDTAEPLGITN